LNGFVRIEEALVLEGHQDRGRHAFGRRRNQRDPVSIEPAITTVMKDTVVTMHDNEIGTLEPRRFLEVVLDDLIRRCEIIDRRAALA
jgi:hypothetical protein